MDCAGNDRDLWSPPQQNLHTVSFSKPGHMELRSMSFDVGTEISLSFATKSDKGIILFGSGSTNGASSQFQLPKRRRRQSGEVRGRTMRHTQTHTHIHTNKHTLSLQCCSYESLLTRHLVLYNVTSLFFISHCILFPSRLGMAVGGVSRFL